MQKIKTNKIPSQLHHALLHHHHIKIQQAGRKNRLNLFLINNVMCQVFWGGYMETDLQN